VNGHVYEVWSWPEEYPASHYYNVDLRAPLALWHFHGWRMLSLREVQEYQYRGYHVERSRDCDRTGTLPLFPRLDATEETWFYGLG
jgi:hypothetical protein